MLPVWHTLLGTFLLKVVKYIIEKQNGHNAETEITNILCVK